MNACYTVGDMDAILSLGDRLREERLTPDHSAYHLIVTSHISKLVSCGDGQSKVVRRGVACSATSVSYCCCRCCCYCCCSWFCWYWLLLQVQATAAGYEMRSRLLIAEVTVKVDT